MINQSLRYILLAAQLIFIVTLVYQFESLEKNAQTINIKGNILSILENDQVKSQKWSVDYDINTVSATKWKIDDELIANDLVYVTLEENEEEIYEVKSVTTDEPQSLQAKEIVVRGYYSHELSNGTYYIYYGFESFDYAVDSEQFIEDEEIVITIEFGKWGQQKVAALRKQ